MMVFIIAEVKVMFLLNAFRPERYVRFFVDLENALNTFPP